MFHEKKNISMLGKFIITYIDTLLWKIWYNVYKEFFVI